VTCYGCAWYVMREWTDSDGEKHYSHLCCQGAGEMSERWATTLADDIPPACSDRWCKK